MTACWQRLPTTRPSVSLAHEVQGVPGRIIGRDGLRTRRHELPHRDREARRVAGYLQENVSFREDPFQPARLPHDQGRARSFFAHGGQDFGDGGGPRDLNGAAQIEMGDPLVAQSFDQIHQSVGDTGGKINSCKNIPYP